jgi:hypothetical protein
MTRTLLRWAAAGLVVWYIIENPHAAAGDAHWIGSALTAAAHGISAFLAALR